jgi:glycosyltransferase involved in cell wall biosynthesis
MYASLASFICRVPVICTFHGYIDLKNNRKIEAIKYFLIGLFATKIVAVSEGLMKYLIDLSIVGKNKFCTIYNGIDILKISKHSSTYDRNIFGVSENNILIGSIGNLKEAKGYDILIKVAKVVTEKYDNCRFMIAGNIDSLVYDELLYLRKGLSLDSYVIFTGYLENVEEYLQMIDIFLLTSNSEGFSLATIEAMNAGIPVVATRCGGPQEIISHKNNGLLADVGDELSLAREIFRCIEDTNLKNILVDNAKKLVSERFNVTSMVDKYIKMYYEVINN